MTWLVMPVALRVKRGGWPALWLPLVLLWPLVFAAFCIALPLSTIWPPRRGSVFAALSAAYRTLCALHGAVFEFGLDDEHWKWSLY